MIFRIMAVMEFFDKHVIKIVKELPVSVPPPLLLNYKPAGGPDLPAWYRVGHPRQNIRHKVFPGADPATVFQGRSSFGACRGKMGEGYSGYNAGGVVLAKISFPRGI